MHDVALCCQVCYLSPRKNHSLCEDANIGCGCRPLVVPTVTKVTSAAAAEDGDLLNVEKTEEIKNENGEDHQTRTGEDKALQNNEPSTSADSVSSEVNRLLLQIVAQNMGSCV